MGAHPQDDRSPAQCRSVVGVRRTVTARWQSRLGHRSWGALTGQRGDLCPPHSKAHTRFHLGLSTVRRGFPFAHGCVSGLAAVHPHFTVESPELRVCPGAPPGAPVLRRSWFLPQHVPLRGTNALDLGEVVWTSGREGSLSARPRSLRGRGSRGWPGGTRNSQVFVLSRNWRGPGPRGARAVGTELRGCRAVASVPVSLAHGGRAASPGRERGGPACPDHRGSCPVEALLWSKQPRSDRSHSRW